MHVKQPIDWPLVQVDWLHAHGDVPATGVIKQQPDDFQVVEQMDVTPSGEGEHYWLLISKVKQNTDRVARQLAQFSGVAYRDVGYSGLKDYFALTEQWFSVWLPIGDEPQWQNFEMPGVAIKRVERHSRKIKRGTHSANHFQIVVREFQADPIALVDRLETIKNLGVPNYFGPQRFGRDTGNMSQLEHMFESNRRIKDRNLRGILLSSGRSWLFNTIVSARIKESSWDQLQPGEPANLDGSASIFTATNSADEQLRLASLDIHPTAPLWGKFDQRHTESYPILHAWEQQQIEPYTNIASGLIQQGLKHQRRPIRTVINNLQWQVSDTSLRLSFELRRGQFATSVLREVVQQQISE